MERTVERILKGVKKFEWLGGDEIRVICVEEEVNENKVLKKEYSDDMFVYIDFENFIKNGKEIMAYEPKTENEEYLKALLEEAIEAKIENFYCTKIDPSLSDDGKSIIFEVGKMPAVYKSHNWWKRAAKEFMPECNSRLGTKLQYASFLGVLMKKLVEEKGMSVKDAWDVVCNNSKELGHYRNSENAQDDFEPTGSREICGFCDLANTCKVLAWDDEDEVYWEVGGPYDIDGYTCPLACFDNYDNRDNACGNVGWIVLS